MIYAQTETLAILYPYTPMVLVMYVINTPSRSVEGYMAR